MRPIEAPKLTKAEPKSETPNRHRKVPGMFKRLRRQTILDRVCRLGEMSDVAVIKTARREDLVRNLAFVIHQQKLFGALDRLGQLRREPALDRKTDQCVQRKGIRLTVQCNPWQLTVPPKVEQARLASAERATRGEKR
jgi:hypothetical protein